MQSPSKLGLEAGDRLRVRDAILGIVTQSANDAAVVLAEAIGGSETHFAEVMTHQARALGMMHTVYRNASGLHNFSQVTTAFDQAILARALLYHFPRYYRFFSAPSFTYNGVTHANHNHLMERYDGMDGIKTGFVNASGFNLVASAKRGGHRLVGVVFGGVTARSRDNLMAQLLDRGFARVYAGAVNTVIADSADTTSSPPPSQGDAGDADSSEAAPGQANGDAAADNAAWENQVGQAVHAAPVHPRRHYARRRYHATRPSHRKSRRHGAAAPCKRHCHSSHRKHRPNA